MLAEAGGSESAAKMAWGAGWSKFALFAHFQILGETYLVKNILEPLLRESRALNILDSAQLLGQLLSHIQAQWLLLVFR